MVQRCHRPSRPERLTPNSDGSTRTERRQWRSAQAVPVAIGWPAKPSGVRQQADHPSRAPQAWVVTAGQARTCDMEASRRGRKMRINNNVLLTFPPRPLTDWEQETLRGWLEAVDGFTAFVSQRRRDDPAIYRRIVISRRAPNSTRTPSTPRKAWTPGSWFPSPKARTSPASRRYARRWSSCSPCRSGR